MRAWYARACLAGNTVGTMPTQPSLTVANHTMSTKALAQNATDLAISGPGTLDLDALCAKVASRKAGGLTEKAFSLDYSKLFSAICAEYKSFSGIEPKARLADEVVAQIDSAIERFQSAQVGRFNEDLVSYRCFAAHKPGQARFVRAEVIRRESAMALNEQEMHAKWAVRKAQERVDKLTLAYADADRIEKAKKALGRLEHTLGAIRAMLVTTSKAEEPAKSE